MNAEHQFRLGVDARGGAIVELDNRDGWLARQQGTVALQRLAELLWLLGLNDSGEGRAWSIRVRSFDRETT